jgi:SAM-dependent methyltransferase
LEERVVNLSQLDELVAWIADCSAARQDWKLLETFNQLHPRTLFFKNLPPDARMLDCGAGDGSMAHFKEWLVPKRPDISLTGLSLRPGQFQALYDQWLIEFWTPDLNIEPCDAIFACHFIEHIEDPAAFLGWCDRQLRPGGSLYLEWPEPATYELPPAHEITEATGLHLGISNYLDDSTHRGSPPSPIEVSRILKRMGFHVEVNRTIAMPFFVDKLLQEHFVTQDAYLAQAAFWLKTGWCHCTIARKD